MAYKTILTVVTDADLTQSALDAAIAMANREDAHLDVLCLGLDRTQTGYYFAGANAVLLQETLQRAQHDATRIEEAVRKRMSGETMRWASETAVAQITALSPLIAGWARFADLVILPKPYGPNLGIEHETIVEAALFDGQVPVMIAPHGVDLARTGNRIAVAWNQSAEAMTAIRAALPLLAAADLVDITVIDPPQHGPDRSDPGGLLSQMLGRHGARTEITVLAKTMPRISDVLLRHVADMNADMVVMGAYGHSRFREAILGGATRNMLESATVPVLLAH
ncbi:universal stress protein [Actibacterium sp. XHP0104]|uniref:universal stress protein n=1 Tax=Actibacterium sp. XHP0104 TaxID=2984335 RepID=UPI0021E9082F|nr:universal stress protein [Actibacterium sp. XHP0104]MCV2882821.1 universal stress protein [Actibacterium sp. XHP0104]